MPFDGHANFAYSTVLTIPSPASSGTSLGVQVGDGTKFPAVPFNVTVWPAASNPTSTNAEIIRVTSVSGDTFTVMVRAQEGTSGRTIVAGDQIAFAVTKKTLTDIEAPLNIVNKVGSMTMMGHSYLVGQNQAAIGVSNPYQQGLVAKLQGLFGIHNDNTTLIAQAGARMINPVNQTSGSQYGGWGGFFQFCLPNNNTNIDSAADVTVTDPPTPASGVYAVVMGLNDLTNGFANGDAAAGTLLPAYGRALRGVISRARAGFVAGSTLTPGTVTVAWDSSIAFTGTWTNSGYNAARIASTGPGYAWTKTNGDKFTITIPNNFRGGTVAVNMIGQTNGATTLNGGVSAAGTTLVVAANSPFPSTGTFVVTIATDGVNAAEDVTVTAGAGTNSWTCSALVRAHLTGSVVTISQNTAIVTWSTSGSNATITGTSSLGGQGSNGGCAPVTKRFVCTGADAGKTIVGTISGCVAADTSFQASFDSWQIECTDPPPVVVMNLPHYIYGTSVASNWNTYVSALNTVMANIVAEFDGFVQIADAYTLWYNRNGVITTTMNNTDVTSTGVGFTANSSTFTPVVGQMMTFGLAAGEDCIITAVSGTAPNWTLSLLRAQNSTAKVTHAISDVLCSADWMFTDKIHANAYGYSVLAQCMYDAFLAMPAIAPYQLAQVAGNWAQFAQTPQAGIIDAAWSPPPFNGYQQVAVTANRQFAYPIFVPRLCIVSGVALQVTTGTTVTARFGIYSPDATHLRPGALIIDFGSYTLTGTAIYSASKTLVYQVLRPGWYWISVATTAGGATLNCCGSAGLTNINLSRTTVPLALNPVSAGYYQDSITGAFANWVSYSEAAVGTAATAPPGIFIQYRAEILG